jgi:hypothetical protein
MLIGSGLQVLTTLGKFKPAVLGEIQAGGDILVDTPARLDHELLQLNRGHAGDAAGVRFAALKAAGNARLAAQLCILNNHQFPNHP